MQNFFMYETNDSRFIVNGYCGVLSIGVDYYFDGDCVMIDSIEVIDEQQNIIDWETLSADDQRNIESQAEDEADDYYEDAHQCWAEGRADMLYDIMKDGD